MKVSEMIVLLQAMPQDASLLVDGFDSTDFDHAAAPAVVRVVPVKQTSHGAAFAEDGDRAWRHYEVIGDAINAVHIGIGDVG